ncbi:MAG: hypothetical protein DMD25_04005 [Gemmatimonadetes bacterium]|nr:MAG: hypothetical protein DMD25_04005 [Gemmatimonadota bacterium]
MSRWTPAGRSCGISSACCRRPSWSSCNGRTRHISSRAARCPPTDAHRRQCLPGRLPVPARARYLAGRVAARYDARRDRRGVGQPPAEPVLAPADGRKRLAVRDRGARAAAQTGARAAPGALGLGSRGGRGGGPWRAGGAVRSAVLRARPDRTRDARPRRGLRCGESAHHDDRAPRGRTPAAPERPRRRASRGGGTSAGSERRGRAARAHACRSRVHRRGAFRIDPRGGGPTLVGRELDLGPPRRSPRDPAGHDRGRAVRVRHWAAAADSRGEHREARSARAGAGAAGGDRVGQRPRRTVPLTPGWEWGLIPAVPVPFRGRVLAEDALQAYATWMAGHQVAGVAVWAHTGRGPHLSSEQRRRVLAVWRGALPMSPIVAGVTSVQMAAEAKAGGANALLAFPQADDPVGYHAALGRELPVIAFYLYEAAGGVAYDNQTLHAILALPSVMGIKVATLDSVVTFQRIAGLMRHHPDKLLITGEDRFLGYSLTMGARAALIGMGAALTDLQVALMESFRSGDFGRFVRLSGVCDRFASATFIPPMEGYVRRMLWALAADGVIPDDTCDDPWGPSLPPSERDAVRSAVREARTPRLAPA